MLLVLYEVDGMKILSDKDMFGTNSCTYNPHASDNISESPRLTCMTVDVLLLGSVADGG